MLFISVRTEPSYIHLPEQNTKKNSIILKHPPCFAVSALENILKHQFRKYFLIEEKLFDFLCVQQN